MMGLYNNPLLRTPPPLEDTGIRETPRPVKARIVELERQNNILLSQKHALEVSPPAVWTYALIIPLEADSFVLAEETSS